MTKLTVLDLVQDILSAMESDNVNSIVDTVESNQVAAIVQECFEDIVTEFNLGAQGQLIRLEASGLSDKPALLRMNDSTSQIEWINYGQGSSVFTVGFVDFGEGGSYIGYASDACVLTLSSVADSGVGECGASVFGSYTVEGIYTDWSGSNLKVVLSSNPPADALVSLTIAGTTYNVEDASTGTDDSMRVWTWEVDPGFEWSDSDVISFELA